MRSVRKLKRDLLLFEKIHVMGLHQQIAGDTGDSGLPVLDDATAADCDYLIDAGILTDAPAFRDEVYERLVPLTLAHGDEAGAWDGNTPIAELPPIDQAELLRSTAIHPTGVLPYDRALPPGAEIVVARAEALASSAEAVAVLDGPIQRDDWTAITGTFLFAEPQVQREATVAEVVLPHVPVPRDDVPIDALLDFRQESSTTEQIKSLRIWMAKAALTTTPQAELELEVESMLHDFGRHMELADMRGSTSALQLAVSIPLQIVEELLHLRPRAALGAAFAVRDRRADRLEAELSAPGSELAYLHTARHRFA